MKNKKFLLLAGFFVLIGLFLPACSTMEKAKEKPRQSLFIAVDVSGSFFNTGVFNDAIDFLSIYIYAKLHGLGGLSMPKSMFVGSVGADNPDDPSAFHPIHDFQDKSVEQIKTSLFDWFPKSNRLTDFNVFFEKVADIVKKYNLVLAPTSIVLVSDGIQDTKGISDSRDENIYKGIHFSALEYLARNITVRLLYPTPKIADNWENLIKRKRVRFWSVEREVMAGWHHQYQSGLPIEQQDKLFKWIKDNVDFRVKVRRL